MTSYERMERLTEGEKSMRVLSLFDGMACGMLAMKAAGIEVTDYDAYEIDKYAMQVATHNFPEIREHGDVFKADFTQYKGVDFVVGGSPCFVAGTQVFTSEGMKDIEEVKVGDMVYTHMNRFRMVTATDSKLAKVSELHAQGIPPMLVTDNHPFYTSHMERVWNNDRRCHEREFTQPCWREVGALSKGDFLSSPVLTKEENPLGLTEEVCWILGRYVADGHCRKDKRKGRKDSYQYQMILSVGKDKVVSVKDAIKSYNMGCYPHTQSTYRCVISNKELVDLILDNDFGRNAVSKNVPNIILNLPKYLAESFLKGYLSGDGHFSTQWNQWSCTTVSKRLAYSLALLVQKVYGCNASISYRALEKIHVIEGRTVNQRPQYIITFREGMKKQSVAKRIGDHVYTPFKSRRDAGMEIVYNLSVDEDESYIANNRVVHNCTYWSIAQTKNRETEAHGIGWELFQQYVRAIREAEPRFFVYENNKSMSDAIRKEISETFGFEPICINSALVSAQNRQRLYWVGVRQDDGTYRKADIDQPDDRGILLKDVLDDGWVTDKDKSHAVIGSIARTTHREYFQKAQGQMVAEPVNVTSDGKTHTLKAQYYKNGIANFVTNGGFGATGVAEPIAVASRTRENDDGSKTKRFEVNGHKANCLTTVQTDCMVAEPIRVGSLPRPNGELSTSQAMRVYSDDGKAVGLKACGGGMGGKTGLYAIPCESLPEEYYKGGFDGNLIGMIENEGSYRNGSQPSQQYRVYSSEGKSVCVDSSPQKHYIVPNEDDKQEPIYEVKDGMITIKDKQYPIKLADGFYIIRKLTVDECERLQTVPNVKESVMFNLIDDSVEVEKWFIEHQSNRAQSVGEKCHKSQKLAENVENIDLLGFVQCAVNNSSTKLLQIKEPAQLNVHISSEVVSNPKGYFAELKKNVSTVARHSDCPIAEQIDVFVQAIAGISMLLERTAPLGKVDVLLNGRSIATLMNGKMSSNISGKEMRELVNSVDINANTVMKTITSITSDPGQDIQNIDQTLIILYSYVKNVIGSSTLSRMWTSVSFTIERRYTAPVSNTQAYKCLGNGWTIEVIAHLIRGALASVDENPIVPEKGRQAKLDEWVVED